MTFRTALLTGAFCALAAAPALADGCEGKIGVLMELTGPAGAYGQAGEKAVELALHDLDDAGCKLSADVRDSQSQGTIAVDAPSRWSRSIMCRSSSAASSPRSASRC